MRLSGTHLYERVCPLVRRSVGPLRLCKNRGSRPFLATVRSFTETNDQPTCFESLLHYSLVSSVCSSICLSSYVTWSIHAETQSRRIFARSGLLSDEWYFCQYVCNTEPFPAILYLSYYLCFSILHAIISCYLSVRLLLTSWHLQIICVLTPLPKCMII